MICHERSNKNWCCSYAEPGTTQEGEAGDSPKAEKTTNEEILQAEQDGKTLDLEDVAVECQNQQNVKRIILLISEIEQLKAANSKLQNEIDEISTTLRNTNLKVESLSAQNVLHDTEETENLLPEQQDQSQLEAQKSELERELKKLLEQSHQSQKEIYYLQDRHDELIEMIKTAETAHNERKERMKREIGDCLEEREVLESCIRTWSDSMLILKEESRQMKETAEPIIYSMNDAALRLESEVVERIRNFQMQLMDCRNKLFLFREKEGLAQHHENLGLAIDNNEIEKELQTMELNVLEVRKGIRELKAKLNDEERIKSFLDNLCSGNDDSEVQEGGVDDVVASGVICQSEEAKKTTDEELSQSPQDEKALNLEDVAVTSEKQQGSRKNMDVLRSEVKRLQAENARLQIGIDKISNMVMDTNLEVAKLNEAPEGAGEFTRPACALQSLSAQDELHEISQLEANLFQEPQQDQTQLGAQNSDLEKEIQEMRKRSSLAEKRTDDLRARGNALTGMIEAAETARQKKIQEALRDMENCREEGKVHKQCIQRCSDRERTLEEELRQMKGITMPATRSLHDSLLGLKLEVEEKFGNMEMRLSACSEELQKQKAELMTSCLENQKCTTMSHEMKSKMKTEVQNMRTVFLEMIEEMEKKSGKQLHDMERAKKTEDLAESEKMLEELNMRKKDQKDEMSDLKTLKLKAMVLLSMQEEQYMEDSRELCQLIHRQRSICERLRRMYL